MLKGITCIAALSVLAACTDGIGWDNEPAKGTGKIALAAELDASVVTARSSRGAEYTDVQPADLALRLSHPDGSADTWNSIADFPLDRQFKVGKYTLEAYYGDEATEGFESPYFYGKTELTVADQKTTAVSLTAQLANSMVTIVYTDAFKDYMESYSAKVHSAGGAYTDYVATETRPVYVKPGDVSIDVEFVKPNGKGATIEAARFTAKARTHHRVTIDLGGSGAGASTITVSFDETVATEDVEIDISDDVLAAPAPTVTTAGFTPGETVSFVEGMVPDLSLKADIIAKGGLAGVTLTTTSASLLEQGWPAEINLVGASAEQQALLKSLGLEARGVFGTTDKLAVIDLSGIAGHIRYKAGGDNATTITIVAKDRGSKVSDPVSITFSAEQLSLSLDSPQLYVGSADLYVNVNFNGGKPQDNVTIQYHNSRGTWTNATATFTEASANVYRAHVTVPGGTDDITVRAIAGDAANPVLTSAELKITRDPLVVANGTANAFARKAFIPVTIGSQDSNTAKLTEMMAAAKVYISTDGTNFAAAATASDPATKTLEVTGLSAATAYTAKIVNGSQEVASAVPFTFTTEATPQLPNANLDSWTSTAHKSNMVEYYVGGDVWSTYNPVTISQWESSSNMSYNATSGTKETGDAVSGKAALIRTVGWGSGNTASGNAFNQWSFGTCKHVSAGQLFLGNWDNVTPQADAVPNYGTAFQSRPSAVSFQFKYSVTNRNNRDNGDFGTAEVEVLDASGNVISRQSANLGITQNYTKKTLSLAYTATSHKAAKIRITFKSSGNPAALVANENYMKPPKPLNLSDGEYVGSQLYIDDISLEY